MKKMKLAAALTCAAMTANIVSIPVWAETDVLGDADGDGAVSIYDCIATTNAIAQLGSTGAVADTAFQTEMADVNENGMVDVSDAAQILQNYMMIAMGYTAEFVPEEFPQGDGAAVITIADTAVKDSDLEAAGYQVTVDVALDVSGLNLSSENFVVEFGLQVPDGCSITAGNGLAVDESGTTAWFSKYYTDNYFPTISVTVTLPETAQAGDVFQMDFLGEHLRTAQACDTDYMYDVTGGSANITVESGTVESGALTFEVGEDAAVVIDCDDTATEVEIPAEIDGVPVTAIGEKAFAECHSLTSVTIPESVTSIGRGAFMYCLEMPEITIPESVTTIEEGAFAYCTSLTSVVIPEKVATIGEMVFMYCEELTTVTISEGVTSIGDGAFTSCTGLTSVVIPRSVTSIADNAFYDCTALADVFYASIEDNWNAVVIGETGNESLLNAAIHFRAQGAYGVLFYQIGDGFITVTGIEEGVTDVVIPSEINGLPVGFGEDVFYKNTEITSVTIECEGIPWGAFTGCTALETLILGEHVTTIEPYAFSGCSALTTVTLPESLTYIGEGAFGYCTSLTAIEISENNQKYCSVDSVLFTKDGTELMAYPAGKGASEYVVPDGVTTLHHQCFLGADLDSIVLPDGMTALEEGFHESGITKLTIPVSVTDIASGTFEYCTTLTDVYYMGSEEEWNAITISEAENDSLLNATIHFAVGSEETALGDLNGDSSIDANDATTLLIAAAKAGAGLETGLTAEQIAAADLNDDGTYDANDATLILQYAAQAGAGTAGTIEEFLASKLA